jgi:hypothetical protein
VEYTAEPTEETMPTLDEMKEVLKTEHSIDLDALLEAAKEPEGDPEPTESDKLVSALSALLDDRGVVKLSKDGEPASAEILQAVKDAVDGKVALSARVDALEEDVAKKEIDDLVRQGRVLPAKAEAMLKLSRADRATFEAILPDQPIIKLSSEEGTTEITDFSGMSGEDVSKTIDRYVELAVAGSGKK